MSKPRIIAFYLPQFHPIKENDEWWGKGFTEWTNVGKAKPLFKGHDQPRVPTELGYYDLRMPEVREQQAQLAREAGIEGFMYWHYWFGNGKTLMSEIINEVIATGKPDFPFCLGWANHPWYAKRWNHDDNRKHFLLQSQEYPGEQDAIEYFKSLLPAFKDNRYIKVDDKPIFYVFDPKSLPELYIDLFKEMAIKSGLKGIYIVANIVDTTDKSIYLKKGYDAVTYQRLSGEPYRFQKNIAYHRLYKLWRLVKGKLIHRPPNLLNYKEVIPSLLSNIDSDEDVIPTIIPQWDHSPRSGWYGTIYEKSTPELFKIYATKAFNLVKHKKADHQLIFLKSWNEWGEGNYMEPDLTHGRGYIDALSKTVQECQTS